MIQRLAETDCRVIVHLMGSSVSSEMELAKALNLSKSTISKCVNRLFDRHLVVKERSGKYYWCKINRHKKKELKELLAIWKKCNCSVQNPDISILRIHNFNIYSNCSITNYNKDCFTKCYPNNRICLVGDMSLGIVNIDCLLSKSGQRETHPVQMFIKPFYLMVKNEITEEKLEIEINREITSRYFLLREELQFKGIELTNFYEVNKGHIAIMDDWLAQTAIKYGIRLKDEIDESIYGLPEYESKGKNAIKIIHNVIKERRK